MNINSVDAAEKEASEVLHSLLSVERIENPVQEIHGHMQQVLLVNTNTNNSQHTTIPRHQWDNSLQQSVFENYQNSDWEAPLTLDAKERIPERHTLQVLQDSRSDQEERKLRNFKIEANAKSDSVFLGKANKQSPKIVKKIRKSCNKEISNQNDEYDEHDTKGLEESAQEVRARFQLGCECQDDCCFKGLSAENVYKHRLNIAELTKEEHDMYLMGVTMACMADPGVTAKQRVRRRLRAQYVYQGRRVCLSAFLYLENCTLYQLKRIRKHVMTHGVAPRVHGNHGKKPHNVFSLDTYRFATDFLKNCIEQYGVASSNPKAPVLFPADITRKTIHDMYKEMVLESGSPGQKVMGYTTFRHFMKVQFPQVRFCKLDSGTLNTGESKSAIAKYVSNIINSSLNNSTSTSSQNTQSTPNISQQQQHQIQKTQGPPPPTAPQQHHEPPQEPELTPHTILATNYIPTNSEERQNITMSTPSCNNTLAANNLSHSTCPVSVSNGTILSSTQMASIPLILSPSKSDLPQQQTAFIVTPVSQLVQPFQTGHAITVTPISNTAYAFATL